jgi:Endonuclease/Exonuclease/phosphatase family.
VFSFGIESGALAGLDSHDRADREVTVLTRNLYVGAELSPVLGAIASGDPSAIIGAVSTVWASVLSTNFHERAKVLADEIADAAPLLVGLQEVSLFRTGAPDSFFGNPTPADQVEIDYLDTLLRELKGRGLHYAAVAVTQNVDVESTGFVAPGVLRDIRLTDRDVILARTDLPVSQLKLSNIQTANFATNLAIPIGGTGQFFTNLHGWGSVDAKVRGKSFRFINTHLEIESANPIVNAIQVDQAREVLVGPASTALPVILVGAFNSRADGTGTETYNILIGAGFNDAWSETHPGELGNTYGHDADLRNTTVNFTQRLDLVLYRGDIQTFDADIVGDELADRTPSGLWPSDHGGVVAALIIHERPQDDREKSLNSPNMRPRVESPTAADRLAASRLSNANASWFADTALLALLASDGETAASGRNLFGARRR